MKEKHVSIHEKGEQGKRASGVERSQVPDQQKFRAIKKTNGDLHQKIPRVIVPGSCTLYWGEALLSSKKKKKKGSETDRVRRESGESDQRPASSARVVEGE